MEECFHCGNCKMEDLTYYCAARNEFVVKEGNVFEKSKCSSGWKKGKPEYEKRRRKVRQDRLEPKKDVS